MSRPKLLDLFCGAGGAGVGYHRAGFDVIGVDLKHHPEFPYFHITADARDVLNGSVMDLSQFDVIHASPPCPRYSIATPAHTRDSHPDLVGPVRDALEAWGGAYVIENVPGSPLLDPVVLCGSSFGLRVRRHRLFESNIPITPLPCDHRNQGQPVGVYGQHADKPGGWKRPNGKSRGIKATSVADAQNAMGIGWMSQWHDIADAIPPAYSTWIGLDLLTHLRNEAARNGCAVGA